MVNRNLAYLKQNLNKLFTAAIVKFGHMLEYLSISNYNESCDNI